MKMKHSQFISLITLLGICSLVLTNPIKPAYPDLLNLDNYGSVSLDMTSETLENNEKTLISEFQYKENKRVDINTTMLAHSFRSFNGDKYSILITKNHDKKCNHIDEEIDSYMQMKYLKTAWLKNQNGDLLYLGEQEIENVNCNIWKFGDGTNDIEIATSIPRNPSDQIELKRMVRIKNHNNKSLRIEYKNIQFLVNHKIDDKKFEIPEDIKCE